MKQELSISKRNNIVAIIILGSFLSVINQTILTTALPQIMKDFSISSGDAQWVTTIFMLVNGIMIPITAFLIQRFTLRSLFFTSIILFLIGSLLCTFTPNFGILLMGRGIQAMGAGIIMPLSQTVLFIIFPPEKRGFAMGIFGLVIGFAPAIGPTAGGVFTNLFDWRYLFVIIIVIAAINLIFAHFSLLNLTDQNDTRLDTLSVITSTLGFGGLLYGFSIMGELGFSNPIVYVTIIIALTVLIFFITRQLKLEKPMLEFRVFKYSSFLTSMVLIIIMFIILIASFTILPIYMQTMLHISAIKSGLILLPGALLMGILSPVTGKIYDLIGGRILAIAGMVLIFTGTILFSFFSASTSIIYIIIAFAILMVGVSTILTPMQTLAINSLPVNLIPHGTAMNNTMRQISAAIGTGTLVTIMNIAAQQSHFSDTDGLIYGVQITYRAVAVVSFLGIIVAFFIKNKERERLIKPEN